MTFAPVLPLSGYAGWRFLQRTLPQQSAAHDTQATIRRADAAFRDRIGQVQSAADLVADRQLLSVALTAFGLTGDLPNKAYVEKVLESDSYDPRSFANRLSDKRYLALARAFGFGDPAGANTQRPGFADAILDKYRTRSFEEQVGAVDDSMRQAMALPRDLGALAAQDSTERTRWYTVLGTSSLRAVFETAFALPQSFGSLDLDRQVSILQDRTERLTGEGTIAQFTDPDRIEVLTRRFFLASQIAEVRSISPMQSALSLLQQGQAALAALRPNA